uniref:Uncharacterized protein n=1 Tax=Plectus sambesii TaxID=2011161 RepID=A0A914UJI2_9BILA
MSVLPSLRVNLHLLLLLLPVMWSPVYGLNTPFEETETTLIKTTENEERERTKDGITLGTDEFMQFLALLNGTVYKRTGWFSPTGNQTEVEKQIIENRTRHHLAIAKSSLYYRTALESIHDTVNVLLIEKVRAENGHDRAIRLLETQHNTSFTYVEKDKCLITELTQKAEEALERAKTMYSDAAAKFFYEKSRCERTNLPFLCRWLQNCQKRVKASELLKEAAERRIQEKDDWMTREVKMSRDMTFHLQIRLEITMNQYLTSVVSKQLEELELEAKPLRNLVTVMDKLFAPESLTLTEEEASKTPNDSENFVELIALVREVARHFLGTSSEAWQKLANMDDDFKRKLGSKFNALIKKEELRRFYFPS